MINIDPKLGYKKLNGSKKRRMPLAKFFVKLGNMYFAYVSSFAV
ncbi:hypothetical protein LEP1GSC195_0228 [Leptospira wolbachii serovar Codice str. CDC]|uniref:Uncharacterized protein n=1 Tax=Leptospira wolbachii serovar Codice str. CDC TaxID=1218599 RepID=R9A637_9LEPT|nr:hypothetical protein LEP1GSC195_0228 [Leptospira wolbachii serovar Codice str. CDC]